MNIRMAFFPILAALLSVAANTQNSKPLSSPEKAIVNYIDAHQQDSNNLLAKLMNINSGTHNLEGVRAVAEIMQSQLSDLGFKVQWIPMQQVQRAGVLVAEHPCPEPGKCGKRMLLIGHMDTVFEKSSPFQAYSQKGNIGTGPGVSDMKGGRVDMLFALKAMQAAGVLQNAEITVVLSGDEEAHGEPASISRRDMIAAAHHSDVALEFEGTPRMNGVFYGSVSRRSALTWRLRTTGETGHSAGIFSPDKGFGAIYELVRILDAFRTELPEPDLTFNIGMIVGGTSIHVDDAGNNATASGKDNIISPTAYASGDIRTLAGRKEDAGDRRQTSA